MLLQKYNEMIAANQITSDVEQFAIIELFQSLVNEINNYNNTGLLKKIFSTPALPKGLYIYGGVGRGKSMLMDLFYDNLDIDRKIRTHFHAFMLDVHARINTFRKDGGISDPIIHVAQQVATEAQVLCFDEMQVTDIADAMILGRLFEELFQHDVVVVTTSNRIPDDLYKHGLQREQFLPFIALFKRKMTVIPLDGKTDYRLQHLKSLATVYFTPLGDDSTKFLDNTFVELTNNAAPHKSELHVQGRTLNISKMHGYIAQFSFDELCVAALGSADYIELAREFNTILLSDVPKMTKDLRNEAKRFTNLVDELYEHKVKLICSAECHANKLYTDGDNSFEFQRTVSRLIEMQSESYLAQEHIA